ncbi:PucR family transcriptional regulator [Microbacterium sp.]|uniref:PucR family transcriptional regulator n=1 Tax=Microbacterium sp. TaxID=51671 RepID=UPI003A86FF95
MTPAMYQTPLTDSPSDPIVKIMRRIEDAPRLSQRIVERYRTEIPDYARLDEKVIEHDVLPHSLRLMTTMVSHISRGVETDPVFDRKVRQSAERRFHQGVSLAAVLQAYRLWGRMLWQEVKATIDATDPVQVRASLDIVDRIMGHVDHTSVVISEAYFAELGGVTSDRGVLRGDLLDALLGGEPSGPAVEDRMKRIADGLTGPHIVVVAAWEPRARPDSADLRRMLRELRAAHRADEGQLAIGFREHELIVVYPTGGSPTDTDVHTRLAEVAARFADVTLGLARRHDGLAGVAIGYREAAEAAQISLHRQRFATTTHFRDVLLEHIGRASPLSRALIEDVLNPVRAYDAARGTDLVDTLQTFFDSRLNLANSAKVLHVHPNTVSYRLRRIHELTALNPNSPDDLLLLSMGLKMSQLE